MHGLGWDLQYIGADFLKITNKQGQKIFHLFPIPWKEKAKNYSEKMVA
jgi:hypothetical protein